MHYAHKSFAIGILTLAIIGCTADVTPSGLVTGDERAFAHVGHGALPSWITEPAHFPEDLMGRNNCSFAFGQPTAQWDFHSDGACWERPGPDGWTRQQQHRIHVRQLAACGGGSGDVSPVRVCRAPGQPNPCLINPTTGPTGCALCIRNVACH